MSWLVQPVPSQQELAGRLFARLAGGPILVLPGAHDGLAALQARASGFEALYLSGAAYSASRGLPDVGLVSSPEVADRVRDLVRAAGLPVLVDIDTGFGGVLNAARAAREMSEARAAGVQIEDQELPKRCGHLAGKRLVSPEEMAQKVAAVKQAAPELVVVARTDARAVEGLEAAVARARLYREAGADVIFPEALTSEEEFRQVAHEVPGPLLANMTEFGVSPALSAQRLEELGYRMVIFPVSALRVAARAQEEAYRELARRGSSVSLQDRMQTRAELYATLAYSAYEDLDRRLAGGWGGGPGAAGPSSR